MLLIKERLPACFISCDALSIRGYEYGEVSTHSAGHAHDVTFNSSLADHELVDLLQPTHCGIRELTLNLCTAASVKSHSMEQ